MVVQKITLVTICVCLFNEYYLYKYHCFCFHTGRQTVQELITTSWEIERAPETLERSQMQRLQILSNAQEEECLCGGSWIGMASEIMSKNNVPKEVFVQAVRDLLIHGRSKYRNILLTGPANCGKTFLLGPICKIYKCFQNPAVSSFAWVGAQDAEIILLNDFRWSSKV